MLQAGGGVAEWFKAAVLKTAVPQGTVGSNPTPSAMSCMELRTIYTMRQVTMSPISERKPAGVFGSIPSVTGKWDKDGCT